MIFSRLSRSLGLVRYYSSKSSNCDIYSFGSGSGGQLGNGRDYDYESYPYKVNNINGNDVQQLYCGNYHSMFLMNDGSVLTSGWNSFVGSDREVKENSYSKCLVPTLINELSHCRISTLACGRRHIMFIDDHQRVYGLGVGSEYQLGSESNQNQIVPIEIEPLSSKKFVKIVCGWGNSVGLTENGDLFSWGWNADGQAGIGKSKDLNNPVVIKPTLIPSSSKFINIYCNGSDHLIAVDDKGSLFSFGCNTHGQLGTGDLESKFTPTLIQPLQNKFYKTSFDVRNDRLQRIALGFAHSLVIDDDDQLYGFGSNGNMQLAKENQINYLLPTLLNINNMKIKSVSAGRCHSSFIDSSNQLYTFGNQNHGTLGNGCNKGNQHEPVHLDSQYFEDPINNLQCLQVSSGFDHNLIQIQNE
ncbi:hypothetical protein DLAC_10085 [Tieghemostelium lacteum]|uniref:RCC1-like domain-containing protein n=1 Tax=Tieghemostelium lacteum TaxID=361077 RepID=A0A151Z636_TIELA|nr:hypothetical protein DLAC_10085 [Tieghemostelium lacteum]|eukprot:KYQ89421.1 hypothetical protein DLAC_10085 [Tieghemostelium lacteum]